MDNNRRVYVIPQVDFPLGALTYSVQGFGGLSASVNPRLSYCFGVFEYEAPSRTPRLLGKVYWSWLHRFALICIALHCLALPCIALLCFALLCFCLALHGFALMCVVCIVLHCFAFALLCLALHCSALSWFALRCFA